MSNWNGWPCSNRAGGSQWLLLATTIISFIRPVMY